MWRCHASDGIEYAAQLKLPSLDNQCPSYNYCYKIYLLLLSKKLYFLFFFFDAKITKCKKKIDLMLQSYQKYQQ